MTDNTLTPTDADIIALADETRTGEPGREGYILPISFARAVLAKWGAPAPASQSVAMPAGMEPVVWRWETHNGHAYSDSHADGEGGEPLYTAAQVQAMLAAAPRNATLYDPDDVAFPVQRCADGTDAPTELTSIAAAEVAAPIAPGE